MTTPAPDWTASQVLAYLESLNNADNIAGMARFGIVTDRAIGVSNNELRKIARQIKRNHQRALALFDSGVREARLLASYTAEPRKLSIETARAWTNTFNSWEIVDGVSDLFVDAGVWRDLIPEFAADEREFVRRTAFAMIVWVSVHLKKEPDETVLSYLPLIAEHASDPRNFVKKAVNWALRSIGKRNFACNGPALELAQRLASSSDKTERWNGKDAVRELTSPAVMAKLQAISDKTFQATK